jgi:hypothetical protein
VKSRETPQYLVVPRIQNTRSLVSIRGCSNLDPQTFRLIWTVFPPLIRQFAAGNPQSFQQAFRGESSGFPRLFRCILHRFSLRIPYGIHDSFSSTFPRGLADRAGEKKGEKKAGMGWLWKKVSN